MIILHLYPTQYLPIIPPSQGPMFSSLLRYQLYSHQNAKAAESQVNNSYSNSSNSSNNSSSSSNINIQSNLSGKNQPPPKFSPTKHQDPQESYHPSNNKKTAQKEGQPSNLRSNTTSSTQYKGFNHDTTTSTSSTSAYSGFVSDESVTAMAEAAKETAGALAKSLFSFASTTMKSVADVTTTAANLSINSITSATATTVGKTKVVVIRELADGGFGKVFLVNDVAQPMKQYAMKQMHCQSAEQEQDAFRELQALQKFGGHENIIRLIDSGSTINKHLKTVLLLFPLCSQGTAWDAIARADPNETEGAPWPFPERRALSLILGIAKALTYIHDKGFTHRDVKPHNMLLDDDGIPLLTDFGSIAPLIVEVPTRQRALVAEEEAASKTSAPYRSPELTQVTYPCVLDGRVDVWGLGCSLYCLAFGWSPFESKREGVLRLAIINGRYTYPSSMRMRDCSFSQTFKDIVDAMLTHDMTKRPHCAQVVSMLEQALQR